MWKPLLHEVAAGSLNIEIDSVNFREHAIATGYSFQQGSMIDLDREKQEIILDQVLDSQGNELLAKRSIRYDYLVMAVGSVSNDFGIPGVKENCLFLDSTEQAINIKNVLVEKFLRFATQEHLNEKIKIAIIGAGATGVELSAEMLQSINQLRGYGYKISKGLLDISIVEAAENILPKIDKLKIQQSVTENLNNLGINILNNTKVIKVDEDSFTTADNVKIASDLIIWASGIKAPDFLANIGDLETNKLNQILIKPNLQTTIDTKIFAIGDCAGYLQADGTWVPPRAQAARQMGVTMVKNFTLILKGQSPKHEYKFKDLGTLVNLADYDTVGNLLSYMGKGVMVEGKVARIAYTSLYRMHLFTVHGFFKGAMLFIIKFMSRVVRPKLKLH